ncbi:MAG: hypothetical protein QM762_27125 [Chryseolinea sp.]
MLTLSILTANCKLVSPEEIMQIIDDELKSHPDITNVYGVDLTTRLVVPTVQQYWNSSDKRSSEHLWTVLLETPEREGYVIYFDESTRNFGLGLQSKNELFDIGTIGTFLRTLYSM